MSEIFRELYCALTNDHIVKEPICLSCGHCICKTPCLTDRNTFKCKICNVEIDKSELKVDMESDRIKAMVKSHLSGLFEELEKTAEDEINSFKSLLENRESTLDTHLKYIEEEIEIRIESIKINLEGLFEALKKDLVGIKKEMIEIQNFALNDKIDTKEFDDNLKGLCDYIKNNQTQTEEKFYEHQENFKNIKKMIQNFHDAFYSCELDLKLSTDQVDKKLIGEIMFGGLKAYKMKRALMNGKFETIQLAGFGVSLMALPNGNLVYSNHRQVFLLNETFEEIKMVSIGGTSFSASNHRNEIYVSCSENHCIILFDLNLNKLKQFGPEDIIGIREHIMGYRNTQNRLQYPQGLCCHDNFLYICDQGNRRIQILNLDLEYQSTIQLDEYPCRVQISETTIGVSCNWATLFYDLNTRALKYKYNYRTFNINYIDSIFCALNYDQFYFFDSEGNFVEKKQFHEKLILTNELSGTMCRHKGIVYMTDFSRKLFKFLA